MKNIQKIAMSGIPASGKGTLITNLANYFKIPREGIHSIGTLRREFAKNKYGITIDKLNELRNTDKTVDTKFDEFQKEYMATHNKWAIEGRLPYFFAPNEAVKIFLTVDKIEAARRLYFANRDSEEKYTSIKHALKTLEKRMKSDIETYYKLYKTNCYDVSNFDIILDTTEMNKNEVYQKAIKKIEKLGLSNF
ncbi:MAG TPA: AAA family ATPase [Candidatus Nanoarchaeia archaeon]|nr:AAA family ATPase [Candidatus Nanoarchaeia archaeon]